MKNPNEVVKNMLYSENGEFLYNSERDIKLFDKYNKDTSYRKKAWIK